jgi:hypothetical protein
VAQAIQPVRSTPHSSLTHTPALQYRPQTAASPLQPRELPLGGGGGPPALHTMVDTPLFFRVSPTS